MDKINKGRAVCSAIIGTALLFSGAMLAACNIEMVKEEGYTEGRYEVTADFTQIELDVDGGIDFTLSYGEEFSVAYTESEQEKFTFAIETGTLVVTQHSEAAALLGYKAKELVVTVPSENKLNVKASVDGALNCTLTGDYGSLTFEGDGAINAQLNDGSAESLFVNCDGAVKIESRDFSADVARFECDGALNFDLRCNITLYVRSDGTCEGTYYGDPTVEKYISGIGELKKGGE